MGMRGMGPSFWSISMFDQIGVETQLKVIFTSNHSTLLLSTLALGNVLLVLLDSWYFDENIKGHFAEVSGLKMWNWIYT